MRRLIDRIEELWCIHMHGSVTWPFRGRYRCSVCFREYPVRFESLMGGDSGIRAGSFPSAIVMEKA